MDGNTQQWNLLEKLGFRFVFMLLVLFMIFFNNGTFPLMFLIMKYPMVLLHQFIPWLGKSLLHLPNEITIFYNGSGDTTYDYVMLLVVAILAVIGTFCWTLLDYKRLNYNRLYYWLTVAVRFYVGIMLINYGLIKVIQLQFPAPSIYRLVTTYGESSPMGLAWTFLGFSKGYNLFMGIAELMAGLLFFRRTVTIGAIITLMTTANVMAVNYFYDVPVKIVSTALVTMCLFLLAPNFVRLFNFFFKGQAATLRTLTAPAINKKWKRNVKYTLKYLLIGFMVIIGFINVLSMSKIYGRNAPKSPLYGAYMVDRFVKNNKLISADEKQNTSWKILMMQGLKTGAIKTIDNQVKYYEMKTDTLKKQISISLIDSPKSVYQFNYQLINNHLTLKGKFDGDSLNVELTKMKFELTDRALNWINEKPYNK